jgi:ribosome-binding factor A
MKKHSRTGGERATRVAEQIHQELAQMIAREVKDPRIGMVTLTSVDITADYAYATVHFTVLPSDDETVARSLEGLRRSAGFMRSQLGRRVRIHTNPELRFVHDRSVEHGVNMSHLIDVANATRASDDAPGTPHDLTAVASAATGPAAAPQADAGSSAAPQADAGSARAAQ